jgi:hypothetical protein
MWQRVCAHHLAALAILTLLAALGIAGNSLAQLAKDAAHQSEARLGLLSRVQGLSLERADRDAAFHRVANRLLMTNTRVDTGAAREIVDGARALERKNRAMSTYLAEVSPILPEEEREAFAGDFQLVTQAVSEVVVRAEALAEEPGDSARLDSVGASTRALDEVLLQAQSRVEGALSRGRNRAETIVERTWIWTGSLGAAALVLAAFAARKRALS